MSPLGQHVGAGEVDSESDGEQIIGTAPHDDALRAASRLSPTDPARLRAQAAFLRKHAADMDWAASELRGEG